MSSDEYYRLFGLERNASSNDIKVIYRKLVKRFHPDSLEQGASPEEKRSAEEYFKRIQEAYEAIYSDALERENSLGNRESRERKNRERENRERENRERENRERENRERERRNQEEKSPYQDEIKKFEGRITFPLIIIFTLVAILSKELNVIMALIGAIFTSFYETQEERYQKKYFEAIGKFLFGSILLSSIFLIIRDFNLFFFDKIVSGIYFTKFISYIYAKKLYIYKININKNIIPSLQKVAALFLIIMVANSIFPGISNNFWKNSQPNQKDLPVATRNTPMPTPQIKIVTSPMATYIENGSSALFSDHFSDSTLNSGWTVINKNSDSQLLLTGTGILRMIASPKNGGSDYYYNSNYNAIRILLPVPTDLQNLDGFVETKMNFLPTNNYQGAGIIVCYDDNPDSNTCDRVAERAFYPKVGGSVVRSGGNYVNYSNITTYFRLMKKGNNFTGWYSSDGANWILNGQGISTKTGKYVGLFAVRQPWDGDTNVYSAVEFDYFNISSLNSTSSTNISAVITPEPIVITPKIMTPDKIYDSLSATLSVGETWNVGNGYTLVVVSIDDKAAPKQVWLYLSKDGVKIDDKVSYLGDVYTFQTQNGHTIFRTRIADIYAGAKSNMVTFTDTYVS
jgi:curved DNA-binding protein CbpA